MSCKISDKVNLNYHLVVEYFTSINVLIVSCVVICSRRTPILNKRFFIGVKLEEIFSLQAFISSQGPSQSCQSFEQTVSNWNHRHHLNFYDQPLNLPTPAAADFIKLDFFERMRKEQTCPTRFDLCPRFKTFLKGNLENRDFPWNLKFSR